MKDWTITVTLTYGVPARNEEQANERATLIAEAAQAGVTGLTAKWAPEEGETDYTVQEA